MDKDEIEVSLDSIFGNMVDDVINEAFKRMVSNSGEVAKRHDQILKCFDGLTYPEILAILCTVIEDMAEFSNQSAADLADELACVIKTVRGTE